MAIKNTERALHLIYDDLKANKMVLPNFQRGFVWDRNKQKSLIASVLVDLPIGSLLILEGDTNDFSKRGLCFPDELEINDNVSCQYVLDGQQRLSTLRTVFYDIFSENDSWKKTWDNLCPSLKTRWFVRVKPEDDEDDYFGYGNLRFDTISHLTDNDIQDFIECKVVHKTKVTEVHHPGFTLAEESSSLYKTVNHIAENYAVEFIVPLYEVDKKSVGLHRKVLQKIAEKRIDELKITAQEERHSFEFYKKIFGKEIIDVEALRFTIESFEDLDDYEIEKELIHYWADLKSQ